MAVETPGHWRPKTTGYPPRTVEAVEWSWSELANQATCTVDVRAQEGEIDRKMIDKWTDR